MPLLLLLPLLLTDDGPEENEDVEVEEELHGDGAALVGETLLPLLLPPPLEDEGLAPPRKVAFSKVVLAELATMICADSFSEASESTLLARLELDKLLANPKGSYSSSSCDSVASKLSPRELEDEPSLVVLVEKPL